MDMQLGETLPKLLPQPVRNMYDDYRLLEKKDTDNGSQRKAIQRIAENCFRLFLSISFVGLMRVGYAYVKTANIANIISLAFVISPSASILVGAGGCVCLSISNIVSAVANRCFADVGGVVLAGIFASFLSENYQHYEDSFSGVSGRWITLASNKISEKIRPDVLEDNQKVYWVKKLVSYLLF